MQPPYPEYLAEDEASGLQQPVVDSHGSHDATDL
jgi:hypothetical protein